MDAVVITMHHGDKHHVRGYASTVLPLVESARKAGTMVSLERDTVPTGQMVHLDPTQIASIQDDR